MRSQNIDVRKAQISLKCAGLLGAVLLAALAGLVDAGVPTSEFLELVFGQGLGNVVAFLG